MNSTERDLVRQDVALSSRTWVVKVGSSVLTGPDGRLDPARIGHLAAEIAAVVATGRNVALVSSGAVASGIGRLGLQGRPTTLRQLQAVAAVGQAHLIRAWDEQFRTHGHHAAQLLLDHADFDSRERYLNIRNTITALFEWGAVPVINENDSVVVAEIKFGDNDRLAAMVANLLKAPLLVVLSVVDGLYESDPGAGGLGRPIPIVRRVDGDTLGLAGDSTSAMGTGGMRSKLEAVSLVTRAGGSVVITSGRNERPLTGLLAGEPRGTLFLAHGRTQAARRNWIGMTARPKGSLVVDEGARKALETGTKSLLAIGITRVEGDFAKGDVVLIKDAEGREVARGLCNYAAPEADRIKGKRTDQVREVLAGPGYDEVVHKDNLVLLN